jgi:hypothetical protein
MPFELKNLENLEGKLTFRISQIHLWVNKIHSILNILAVHGNKQPARRFRFIVAASYELIIGSVMYSAAATDRCTNAVRGAQLGGNKGGRVRALAWSGRPRRDFGIRFEVN